MIALFSANYNVTIDESLETELPHARARIIRQATLDGGVVLVHRGVSQGDRTFRIRGPVTRAQKATSCPTPRIVSSPPVFTAPAWVMTRSSKTPSAPTIIPPNSNPRKLIDDCAICTRKRAFSSPEPVNFVATTKIHASEPVMMSEASIESTAAWVLSVQP